MPKVDVKLASGTSLEPTRNKPLSPVMLDDTSSFIGRGSALYNPPQVRGQVDVNAGYVKYSPMPVPDIVPSKTATAFAAGASFADTLVKSAFEFRQREDQAIVNYQTLELQQDYDNLFYGTPDANGVYSGGYAATTNLDATQKFSLYKQEVLDRMNRKLEKLSDAQKAMAISAFKRTADNYVAKGASHATTQLGAAQEGIKGEQFNSAMEHMFTDIQTTGKPNFHDIEAALDQYNGDPTQRKLRAEQMTNGMLAQYELKYGANKTLQFIEKVLTRFPAVASPSVVMAARDRIMKGEESDARLKREEWRFAQAVEQDRRDKASRALKEELGTGLASVLNNPKGELGNLSAFVNEAMSGHDGITSAEKLGVVENSLAAAIKSEWENQKDIGDKALFKKQLEEQLTDLDPLLAGVVRRELDELEERDEKEIIDAEERVRREHELQRVAELRGYDTQIDGIFELLDSGLDPADPKIRQKVERLSRRDLSEDQRRQLTYITDGGQNFYLEEDLTDIESNWHLFTAGKRSLSEYNLGPQRAEMAKRLRMDREREAGRPREDMLKKLQQFYKLSVDQAGTILFDPSLQNDSSKQAALRNYRDASVQFNNMYDSLLRKEKGLAPTEAAHETMRLLLSDESVTKGMVNLPASSVKYDDKGRPERATPRDGIYTYMDDHSAVLNETYIPRQGDISDSLRAPDDMNLLNYVSKLGEKMKAQEELPAPPEIMAQRKNVEILEYLYAMLDRVPADDLTAAASVRRLIGRHMRQAEHVKKLRPLSEGKYTFVRQLDIGQPNYDGDTTADGIRFYYKDGGGPDAPEMKTRDRESGKEVPNPEGQKTADQMNRAMSAINPGGQWMFVSPAGPQGRYGRTKGAPVHGSADASVILKEIFGSPDYEPYEEK